MAPYRDNGKERANYYSGVYRVWGLGFRDTGKEHGNYYIRIGYILGS